LGQTLREAWQSQENFMPVNRRYVILSLSAATLFGKHTASVLASSGLPEVVAYRQPGCGCCKVWSERMKAAGFAIKMSDDDGLAERRSQLGVPSDLAGCHIALIGPHVFEGHVPPEDIKRFLAEAPEALGLAVPGMPMGSPGMDTGGASEPYDVVLFDSAGNRRVYARH
jgi:hypothetical protein